MAALPFALQSLPLAKSKTFEVGVKWQFIIGGWVVGYVVVIW